METVFDNKQVQFIVPCSLLFNHLHFHPNKMEVSNHNYSPVLQPDVHSLGIQSGTYVQITSSFQSDLRTPNLTSWKFAKLPSAFSKQKVWLPLVMVTLVPVMQFVTWYLVFLYQPCLNRYREKNYQKLTHSRLVMKQLSGASLLTISLRPK